MEPARTRTTTWQDPREVVAGMAAVDGLEALRRVLAGELPYPPIADTIGMRLVEVEPGRVVWEGEPGEHLYNPLGTVHGGVMCTILDSAMSCAVHTLVPPGRGYTTAELKVNFVRPITVETPRVRAEGKVIHPGRQLATAEGRIVDERGRLYAHGTATCMIFDVREPR